MESNPIIHKKATLPIISATDLLKIKYDATELWFVEDLFPAKSITLITGPSDCGKSTFAKHVALSVAQGCKTFLNYPIYCKNRVVLYCSSEDNEVTTIGRFTKQMNAFKSEKCDNLLFCFGYPDIDNTLSRLDEIKPGLIILDTLSDSYNGNPNNWVDIRQWLKRFRNITEKHDCAIIGIHHNIKNSEKSTPDKNKVNGSQAIEAVARSLIDLRLGKSSNERHLTILKSNHLPPGKKDRPVALNLCSDTSLYYLSDSEIVSSSNKTYDAEKWLKRYYAENPDSDLSIDSTIDLLTEKYKDETVPGKTWFSEKLKKNIITETITLIPDRV